MEHPEAETTPRVVALMNQKGGVGKTTTAANLGAALARSGARVLLIDLDPQAHLTLHLGPDPDELELTLYELLSDEGVRALEVVQDLGAGMALLPGHVNLAGLETEHAGEAAEGKAQTLLRRRCVSLWGDPQGARPFDWVLIDCPPSLGLLTLNALALAREVIVPLQAHFLALQGLSKLLETVRAARNGLNSHLRVTGVALCMHEGQTVLAREVARDVAAFMQQHRGTDAPWAEAQVFEPPVRRNIRLAESPSHGQTIFGYAPRSPGARDYARLAEAIRKGRAQRHEATEAQRGEAPFGS